MQATQPLRTYQPLKAGIAAFVAVAILVAAVIAASLAPSFGIGSSAGTNAGTNAGSGIRIPRDDWANAPAKGPLQLDADAVRNPGQRHVNANVPS